MTYGDCAGELRQGLSWLLNHSAPDAGDGVLVAPVPRRCAVGGSDDGCLLLSEAACR